MVYTTVTLETGVRVFEAFIMRARGWPLLMVRIYIILSTITLGFAPLMFVLNTAMSEM